MLSFYRKPSTGFLSWSEEKAKSLQLPLQGTQVPLGLHMLVLSTITFYSSDTDLIALPRTHQNIPASGPLHVLFSHPRTVFLQYGCGSQSTSCLCSVPFHQSPFLIALHITQQPPSLFLYWFIVLHSTFYYLMLYIYSRSVCSHWVGCYTPSLLTLDILEIKIKCTARLFCIG